MSGDRQMTIRLNVRDQLIMYTGKKFLVFFGNTCNGRFASLSRIVKGLLFCSYYKATKASGIKL